MPTEGFTNLPAEDERPRRLTLLHTNDTHGKLAVQRKWGVFDVGGAAFRASLVREIRAQCAEESQRDGGPDHPVLLLDAGDVLECDPMSHFFHGEPDILAMNRMGYDALTLGNHDLGFSLVALERLRELAAFPFLTCNLFYKGTDRLLGKPSLIKEYGGLRIGIVGATSYTVVLNVHGDDADRIEYRDPTPLVAREVEALRAAGVDGVVFLSHLGIVEDRALAAAVSGIDLIVGGHSHTTMKEPETVGTTRIVQAGRFAEHLGRVDLTFRGGRLSDLRYRLIDVGDREMGELVKGYHDRMAETINQPVGFLDRVYDTDGKYERPAALNQLVLELIRAEAKADVAMETAISIGGRLGPGWVKRVDLYDCMPFDNFLTTLTITGRDLKRLLAYRLTVRKTAFYTQVSGIDFGEREDGADASVGGAPIDDRREYLVATDNYLSSGGGKDEILPALPRTMTKVLLRDLLAGAIARGDLNRLHAAAIAR